jgi:hypothetical protein
MRNEYEHNGHKIIVDFVENDEVYYRKFRDGEFILAGRMSEIDFRKELEKHGLKIDGGIMPKPHTPVRGI